MCPTYLHIIGKKEEAVEQHIGVVLEKSLHWKRQKTQSRNLLYPEVEK